MKLLMEEVTMNTELILECSTASILIIEERKKSDIVIGVPHHAPMGVKYLKAKNKNGKQKEADENTGFLGKYIAEKLDCHSVIACNYTIDVNKFLRSDYTMQIAQWNPKFLVEIHGHGGNRANFDIEISSGEVNNKYSKEMAQKLQNKCSKNNLLQRVIKNISGDYDNIYYQASEAVTINDGRWLPFHIELPDKLRISKNKKIGKPPDEGYLFCDYLVEALNEKCQSK